MNGPPFKRTETMNIMNFRALFQLVLISVFLVAPLSVRAEIQMLDRIVAIVDDTTVTQSELDQRLMEIVVRSKKQGITLPPQNVLRSQVLDQLVTETLQLNMAKRFGVKATDEEVLQAIQRVAAQNQMSPEQIIQQVQADGQTINEYKETIRKQLTLQNISQGVVGQRIKISENDINNFLNSADAQFWISPEYHLQHILIPVSGSGTEASKEAEEKAQAIFQSLKDGANFTEIAIAESKGPAALRGGDLGFRKATELPTLFAKIAPTLELNQVSEPSQSQAGFHILKLLDKRGENKRMVTQNKVRHILIQPNEVLNEQQAYEKIQGIRARILNGEDFGKLAKEFTEDIGSKMSGGDVGWSNPGTFVPQFEAMVQSIELNTVSEPILTQFGWHILEVTGRRDEDLSEEMIRGKAYNLLVSRRFEDEVQVWLQELRDDAFIELKI